MKDYVKIMKIHRAMLEQSADILEIVEEHYIKILQPNMSEERKIKYNELYKHAQALIKNLNEDLHILVKLDSELKDLEKEEANETKNKEIDL